MLHGIHIAAAAKQPGIKAHLQGVKGNMNSIIYIVGLVVIVLFILSFLGLR
ncbi:hypothetical protein H4P12_04645 [Paracoccus sp. 11-3]|uniref:Uncharacterized protein n=1 Tax=Paracoccus amoyensis TaxID=2760093 RepID=A0A926GBH1_9RHOB|nr:hypothetical protein [Paracoccus amoyensis]MBC9246015.1 hypothetical protein [Paracoccus amoyensis]